MIMKMQRLFFVILFIFIFNPAVFASEIKNKLKQNDGIYTENTLNIIVSKDHPEFTLKLKSNPTTGFSWFLREYSRNLVKPLKHSFQKPTQQLMGAPGYEWWTFRIKPAGFIVPQSTTVRMIYARPWQGMDNSIQLIFRISTIS